MSSILQNAQVTVLAGASGIGKTSLIRGLIQQNTSGRILYFCPSSGTVPIDSTQIQIEFPHVQIITEGQELELIEAVGKGADAYIELGFHLDLRSGDNLLQALSEYPTQRIAIVPTGLKCSEWHEWATEVQISEMIADLNQIQHIQMWRSPCTGQMFDPSSLNVIWYELTQGAYGDVCRCKGIFDLPDGRSFYVDFVKGNPDSLYLPLHLPRWLDGRPIRFSGIEVMGRNLDGSAIVQAITDSCLTDDVIAQYQQQIKQSLSIAA